jgi:hypothetical protein
MDGAQQGEDEQRRGEARGRCVRSCAPVAAGSRECHLAGAMAVVGGELSVLRGPG